MSAERRVAPRGKFSSFDIPRNPATVKFQFRFGQLKKERTFATQFTLEEVDHIRRARQAMSHPGILDDASHYSTLRIEIPWGEQLTSRQVALVEIQAAALNLSIVSADSWTGGYSEEMVAALRTARDNLLPFLPPENPPVGEGTTPSRRER